MKIIVYGSKKQAEYFINSIMNIDIVEVVDSYSSQFDKNICGYIVKSKDEVDFDKVDYVVVCSNAYEDIKTGLRERCTEDKVIVMNYDNISYKSVKEFELNPIYDYLNDYSKEFYKKKIEERIEEKCLNKIISTYEYQSRDEYPESLYEVSYSHEEKMIAKMLDFFESEMTIDLVEHNCFGYKNYLDTGLNSLFVTRFNYAGDCYPILKYIENYKRNINCAFDIGANRGLVSLFLSRVANEVHAFEPSSEMTKLALNNIELNGVKNILWNNVGLSDKKCQLELNEYGIVGGGHNSFIAQNDDIDVHKCLVDVITVDQYCSEKNIDSIDLMKIDVEGFEPYVIAGAKNMLEKNKIKCLIFEVSPSLNYEKNDYYEMLNYLERVGYQFYNLHNNAMSIQEIIELTSHRDIVASI